VIVGAAHSFSSVFIRSYPWLKKSGSSGSSCQLVKFVSRTVPIAVAHPVFIWLWVCQFGCHRGAAIGGLIVKPSPPNAKSKDAKDRGRPPLLAPRCC